MPRKPCTTPLLNRSQIRRTQDALLRWFQTHKRDLPWRKSCDPYLIWVSEIMLQQTQVATVVPYYERWVHNYPSIAVLAKAREDEVLKAWEGLGYYSRARNLMHGARHVMLNYGGQLPSNVNALRSIPGIGRYTAGAIASIAFDLPEPVLDGNVMRVLCRLRDLEGDPRKAPLLEQLWSVARELVADTNAARLNESLMELGALVCTRQGPKCSACPLNNQCLALKRGTVDERPQVAHRPDELARTVQIVIAERGRAKVLLHQQDEHAAHWANLWTFPFFEVGSGDPGKSRKWLASQLGLSTSPEIVTSRGKYAITRYRFSYFAVKVKVTQSSRRPLPPGYSWIETSQLSELPMPAPHRRLSRAEFEPEK
jgi:A/G-specific adenine glycosylase